MIDRSKCYCDEAESFVREQMDCGLEVGDAWRFDAPRELTHIPREVVLDDRRMALLVSFAHGGLGIPSTVEYEILPR